MISQNLQDRTVETLAETRHTPRIADLNQRHNPRKLSHYYSIEKYDAEIMGGPKAVALCGYQSPPDYGADIHGYARGRGAEQLVCPHCAVLYSMLPSRGDGDRS